jgi:hypothetical protein
MAAVAAVGEGEEGGEIGERVGEGEWQRRQRCSRRHGREGGERRKEKGE